MANELPTQLEVTASGVKHSFSTAAALEAWAEEEASAWVKIANHPDRNLRNLWNSQGDTFAGIAAAAKSYRESAANAQGEQNLEATWLAFNRAIAGLFSNITKGNVITSEHPDFPAILALSKEDPEAAALLLAATIPATSAQVPNALAATGMMARLVRHALSPMKHAPDLKDAVTVHQNMFGALRSDLEAQRELRRKELRSWTSKAQAHAKGWEDAEQKRVRSWGEFLQRVESEWSSALKTYDEKMALAAPTAYWNSRARDSKTRAIWFAVAFAVVTAIGLFLFIEFGLPHLTDEAKPEVSVLIAVLPVLIPAFVAVWVLRIVGRQLSENLQLMQDATERETMVKTFLALMHDEVRGKALVTDDDRLLILHSLFRPSALSAADDSPPVNWFDILSRKLGGPKQ